MIEIQNVCVNNQAQINLYYVCMMALKENELS